jgi:hypothetical protein
MANDYEFGPPPPPPHPAAKFGVFVVAVAAIAAGAWFYISRRDAGDAAADPVVASASPSPSPEPSAGASPTATPTASAASAERAAKPRVGRAAPPPTTVLPVAPSPAVPASVEPARLDPAPERDTQTKPAVPAADPRIYDAATADVTPPSLLTPIGIAPVRTNYVPGPATIEVIVSGDGSVQSAKAGTPPATVGETLEMMNWLSAAKSWRFGPAVRGGQSVKYRLVVPLSALVSGRGIR